MRHAIASLAILTATAGAASAQPNPAATSATAPYEAQQRASQAHQDAFDARIRRRSDAAVRSICAGCGTGGARQRPGTAPRAAEMHDPDGTADERRLVEDPASAPEP